MALLLAFLVLDSLAVPLSVWLYRRAKRPTSLIPLLVYGGASVTLILGLVFSLTAQDAISFLRNLAITLFAVCAILIGGYRQAQIVDTQSAGLTFARSSRATAY